MEHDCTQKILQLLKKPVGRGVTFGPFLEAVRAKDCPVCRTVVHLVKQYQGTEHPITHYPDGTLLKYGIGNDGKALLDSDMAGPEVQNVSVVLRVYEEPDHLGERYVEAGLDHEKGYYPLSGYSFLIQKREREISTCDPSALTFQRKHSTSDGTIDPGFLRSWISAFQSTHDVRCQQLDLVPAPNIRLIDVQDMKLVDGLLNPTYLALSYVWGKTTFFRALTSNILDLQHRNGLLLTELPQSVSDSIIVTRRLGERYLWVDSLCITQDDPVHKAQQIASMGQIYRGAKLVIAAAHGFDADAGLPGVQPHQYLCRAVRRREYLTPNLRLLSTPPLLNWAITRTFWNTRGWTFQESYLSRITLLFTPSQAILLCKCGRYSPEDSALDDFHFQQGSSMPWLWQGELHERTVRQELFIEYGQMLLEYTKRNLSDSRDALNAFEASASFLTAKYGSKFCFGFPVKLLAPTLAWVPYSILDPPEQTNRTVSLVWNGCLLNCEIPSWSWIRYEGSKCLTPPLEWHNGDFDLGEFQADLSFRVEVKRGSEACVLLEGHVWKATFDIKLIKDEQDAYRRNATHELLDQEGKEIGSLELQRSPHWSHRQAMLKSYEVIALCESPRIGFRRDNQWLDFSPESGKQMAQAVDVMFVNRREDGMALRIGIGSLLRADWIAAEPVKIPIVLA